MRNTLIALALTLVPASLVVGTAVEASAYETIHNTVESRVNCLGGSVEQRVREDIVDTETSEVVETRYTAWSYVRSYNEAEQDWCYTQPEFPIGTVVTEPAPQHVKHCVKHPGKRHVKAHPGKRHCR